MLHLFTCFKELNLFMRLRQRFPYLRILTGKKALSIKTPALTKGGI